MLDCGEEAKVEVLSRIKTNLLSRPTKVVLKLSLSKGHPPVGSVSLKN